jgi:ATPase subunit of ABC transporter with duplicated ATPase domains
MKPTVSDETAVRTTLKSILGSERLEQLPEDVSGYLVQVLQDEDALEDDPGALVDTIEAFLASSLDDNDGGKDEFRGDDANSEAFGSSSLAGRSLSSRDMARKIVEAMLALKLVSPKPPACDPKLIPSSPDPSHHQPSSSSPTNRDEIAIACASDDEQLPRQNRNEGARDKSGTPPRPRRERRGRKAKSSSTPADGEKRYQQLEDDRFEDDSSSAWRSCAEEGRVWGGRGRGGRGEYAGAVNSIRSNVHLSGVSLSLPNGEVLLSDSTMDIFKGHCYGLLGINGVGKSSLLRRLARKDIPGLPLDMKVLLVSQDMDEMTDDTSALEVLLKADLERLDLLREQEDLETRLDCADVSPEEASSMGALLGEIAQELDRIDADRAEDRAVEILTGLQFTADMIHGPASRLSGGWRMRLKLAQALFVTSDLILFDECTNHLDLFGLEWLISYFTRHRGEKTLIVVSHDRSFLDAICTDIVVLEHHRLTYHVGNYSEYERQVRDKAARETQILDAAERQRSKAVAFIQKQQAAANKKSADPNKQRQAKMIREKKLDRIGNYREDGKRYKTNSLKKLSEDYVRLAQKVVVEADDPVIRMHFPNPTWPPGVSTHDALIRMEDFAFGYDKANLLFRDVTLNVTRGSKVAIVGHNGSGKTTIVNLVSGAVDVKKHYSRGELWVHPGLRLGHVTQYAVESLVQQYSHLSTVEYAEQIIFQSGRASADAIAKATGNVRQYLGAFGMGGRQALQRIGKLSGGERMRLCFATVLAEQPHILLLDESTNHVDITTLDSMSSALHSFQGAVLMVSHNQGFLSGFCNELWVVDRQRVTVHHSDAATFDEIFSEYRRSIHSQASGINRAEQRKDKADRAKRATQHRTGARQATSLL